jgi:4-hydroxy-3-polyprenylbenzoate decarboxylase
MHKIIVAITGASGSIYAKLLLDKLVTIKEQWSELGLVLSENARLVWETELGNKDFLNYAVNVHETNDFMAPFASGSANYDSMIVAPCSMGTLAKIATGFSSDLISRAADVILKERRKLILLVRETPYNLIHIQNMEKVTLAGGLICPASPSFYSRPKSIEEVAATVVDRVIDLAGLKIDTYRWGNNKPLS